MKLFSRLALKAAGSSSRWRGLGETVMNRYGDLKRPQTGNGCYKTLHFYFMVVNALQY